MQPTPAVSLKSLSKSYAKSVPVLDGIDLEIGSREFVVLVGPSGCGKSTLLRMIAGLEEPSEGEVWIGGRRVDGLEPSERGIAMVFQDYALYPHLSVRENLEFGLRHGSLRGLPAEEREKRVRAATGLLELDALLDRKPAQLSGGQRQRVAIGRALVKEPRVFLFDEPLSNLDAQLRVGMRVELAALHRRLGSVSIYVTHDQVEAMTLADRLVVLKDGVIQQEGRPMDLYRDPDNRFVASFLGTPGMNFLDGRLDLRDGERYFVFPAAGEEGALRLDFLQGAPQGTASGPGKGSVTLGIRPEAVSVARSEAELPKRPPRLDGASALSGLGEGSFESDGQRSGPEIRYPAQVLLVEPHGHEAHLVLEVGLARWVARVRATDLQPGDSCVVELAPEAIHWFDAHGRRVRAAVQGAEPVSAGEEGAEKGAESRGLRRTGGLREHGTGAAGEGQQG